MMWHQGTKNRTGDHARFKDIVDAIFATPDRAEAEAIIDHYDRYWMDIPGTRGYKGDNVKSGRPLFNVFFEVNDIENTKVDTDTDDSVQLDQAALDQLEQEQA
jgi:hypothetical protein